MRKPSHQPHLGLLLALFLAATAIADDNQLTAGEQADGWQLLFDGNSLKSWRTYNQASAAKGWQIEDGALVLVGKGGDLITREAYTNFDLQLEWKVAKRGNSGIFFLADESKLPIYVHAPEIQILDDKRHRDRKQADRRSGSLYDMVAAPPESQRPALQWNQVRMLLDYPKLQVWQNGISTVDINIGGERWAKLEANSKFKDWPGFGENTGGHIGLQDHGDKVWFRNLKIRPLPVQQANNP